ncbi:DUF3800 domain-containing protein [Flavobacterium gawalongense]|uniref:DUF3800 domain-containing protein n=1 Tax=Flavobacterium gawalongense TaxID=2594432 RepID=A0A553BAE1_9FLAO|nr:DUF3800 domain-containing protein [Flavobacterium gawalongense]TRW97059.1 DUF3800 domain-containing protein [Flavobacterium gawalongense]TRX01945.1 DUF3800 domain-containing protein [Flavobacterium gawalongense]TRX05206.1 DUF3800 domain-containing protein [Flavobacterium gawalongense]TRX06019.1 DUF3800 domain-containing protein [Flavobacterium gawalongense]TRX21827.1 DUF3800 domain-containing protein [Flavobacterium gawalongense]
MNNKYDFYIDESCHLENDHIPVMCIGYIKVPMQQYIQLKGEFNQILERNNQHSELKWNKFSNARTELYKELVDFFFRTPLEFRCILVKYKERLNHKDFNQGSHDNFYYKMIYFLLRPNESNGNEYRVFIDVKDTRGREKLKKINEVFDIEYKRKTPFVQFQHLHSHDNVFFQLADFFIGAITYKSRVVLEDIKNPIPSKMDFIKYLEQKSGFNLEEGTEPWETKFNIFDHQPKIKG